MIKVYTPHPDLYTHFTEDERLRWAKYLRDTKIKQCSDTMSEGINTACCLHIWEIYESNGGHWFNADVYDTPSELDNPKYLDSRYLPERLNLATQDGRSIFAAELNDTEGFSFGEIADILEGHDVVKEVFNHE